MSGCPAPPPAAEAKAEAKAEQKRHLPLFRATVPETHDPATDLPKQVQFGDLILGFTSKYQYRYNDKGSGASQDGGFWHPICDDDSFYALGSIGLPNYDNPNGKYASIIVKAADTLPGGKAPLMPPDKYELIWNDRHSGADDDGSCWRPVPPAGYVALGDVFVGGYDAPSGKQIMCVAKELVYEGVVGGEIWNDRHSGASMDLSVWQTDTSHPLLDTPDGVFAVNSFTAINGYNKPSSSPVCNCLMLPLPVQQGSTPEKPKLTSKTRPPPNTVPVLDRTVIVPFTAVKDNEKPLSWQVENSPFYKVERWVDYSLVMFIDNNSSQSQSQSTAISTGVTKEQSETFSTTTGIKVGYEVGVDAGGFSSKTSVELSVELGYSTTTGVSEFRSETDESTLAAAAHHAAALWTESDLLKVRRADNTPVGVLNFNTTDTSYVISEFPADTTASRSTVVRRRRRLL